MRVKIRGGTVAHGDTPHCQTCRYATIVRGQKLGDELIECANLTLGNGNWATASTYAGSILALYDEARTFNGVR